MQRRKFVTSAAIATATTAAIGACNGTQSNNAPAVQGNSQPNVKWRLVASWPQSLDTIYGGATDIAARVSAMTGGRFEIETFAAGEVVPALQVLDAVQAGTVECGHTASYYYIGKNPALAFGSTVPFGLNAQQQNAWLYYGGGLDAMHEIYADFNVINFPAGNTGVQMGGWFNREIQALSDLSGLKMRIPGLGGKVMSRLGVTVQVIGGGEIYLALERGAIDAAEFVGPYDDEKLGLYKAAPFYYYPGWWEPGTTLELQVNRSAWDNLPQEYREILMTATRAANLNMLSKYDALNRGALERLVQEGTQLRAYSSEIMQAAQTASFELFEEDASKDETFRKVYEGWNQFRQGVSQWHQVNELSFARFLADA